ncbi:hypothetical protein EDB85DRAFT_2143324 [Lactarius pseudohatsudake]|nr:hypothetical protein EDB85DRAFT_2143324 [Lactarius pseudohatsudake]
MKEMIFEEIESSTFTVGLTAEGGPLQAIPDDVQKVLDRCSLTYESLFGDSESTAEAPRLPSMAERKSYEPLVHLLNIVVHAANTCLTRSRYLKDLHFDVEMGDVLDSGKPLKFWGCFIRGVHAMTGTWTWKTRSCTQRLTTSSRFYGSCLVWSLVRVFKELAKITNRNRNFPEILRKEALTGEWKDKVSSDTGWVSPRHLELMIFGDLDDERCGQVYKEFIQSGYKHLQTIRKFSNWEDVVEFDDESLNE